MKNEIIEKELEIIDVDTIKTKVYQIRGQQVMLDFDLAEIYGYTTKAFNQQVKNNIDRFKGFIFKTTKQEIDVFLRSKFLTSNALSSKRRYNPYAFTEQGIYMLMTVLRGDLAVEQSRRLITLFKEMKDYIVDSNHLLTTDDIRNKVSEHDVV